jgi:LmbE family N-acetylglucosaminyl deacetylase
MFGRPAMWRTLLSARGGWKRRPKPTQNLFERIAAMRQREALAACRVLGVPKRNVVFLGYPDGGTRAMWETNWPSMKPYFSSYTKTQRSPYKNSYTHRATYCGAQVVSDLEKIIREFRPTRIITTHPEDTHPDHWAAYAYTVAALESLRLSPYASTRRLAQRARLSTFIVHHGIWPAPHGYQPGAELAPPASLENCGTRWRMEPLSARSRNTKKIALDCYVSQLVFTPLYLRSFIRKNELFGQVPSVNLNSKSKVQTSKLLLKDGPADSLWRERWPAADIRALETQITTNGVLVLRADLGRRPSPRVLYRFALHALDGQSTRAFEIEMRWQSGKMNAKLIARDAVKQSKSGTNNRDLLGGAVLARGFELRVPLRALALRARRPTTVLVSASTHAGATRLDQTATATLHLVAPPRVFNSMHVKFASR